MRTSKEIKEEIISRFGFMPPFFEPAMHTPAILENLWQQTLSAYVDNPLPNLFKEKLAALLARYCSVPYCLICHSSTLRPLGMKADEVLELLEQPLMSLQDLENKAECIPNNRLSKWPEPGSDLEECILQCCVAIFLYVDSERCHVKLRAILGAESYDYLMLFIAYNRTCLSWAEAHPELSYEADVRAQQHLGPLLTEHPRLGQFFENYREQVKGQIDRRLHWLTSENRKLVAEAHAKSEVLLETEKKLRLRVQELEEERSMREQFVAIMTHDLRTPLTALTMTGALLERRPDQVAEKIFEMASKIVSNAKRMDRMIGDILDVNRIQAGQGISLKRSECVVNDVLEETASNLQDVFHKPVIVQQGDKIQAKLDCSAIKRVLISLVMPLSMVLRNLL